MTALLAELPLAGAPLFIALILITIALALAIYPGELSWLPGKGNRWLYDKAAANYAKKWNRHSYAQYDQHIQRAAAAAADRAADRAVSATNQTIHPRVLDMACGSGRATRAAATELGKNASYTAVDSSAAMLDEMSVTLEDVIDPDTVTRENCDAIAWLERNNAQFDLVLLMEAAEFIPQNRKLLAGLANAATTGSHLVMTRPASPWWIFFPGRGQSRRALRQRLTSAGFSDICFFAWRSRYELVSAVRQA